METKLCKGCCKELTLDMFSKSKSGKNGLNSKCKVCVKTCTKDYYKKNRTKLLDYKKTHCSYIKKEKVEHSEEYYIKRKLKKAEYGKQWYEDNNKHDKDYPEKQRLKIETLIIEKYKNKFVLLTPYVNCYTKILIKCLACKNEYSITGRTLNKTNHSCIKCKEIATKIRMKLKRKPRFHIDTKYMKNEIKVLTNDEYALIGEYKEYKLPVQIKHNECGHIWNIRRGDFITKGFRCPKCYVANRCKDLGITVDEWGKEGDHDNRKLQRWSIKVKKRDNKKCVICGNDKKLNAHHLNGYNWDIENRDNVNNGVTLCEICHHEFHKIYGGGGNTKEQFEEFEKPKQLALTV